MFLADPNFGIESQLDAAMEGGRPLVNLTGMNRSPSYSEANVARMFSSNVDLPKSINEVAQRFGSTVIHLSSGELDAGDPAQWLSHEFLADVTNDPSNRVARLVSTLGTDWWQRVDPYVASKMMLEAVSAEYPNVTCVRLSNVVGPEYHREGFIPRVIAARLRGDDAQIGNERRNWADSEELNAFIAAIATVPPLASVIPGYGSHDLSSSEVVALVNDLLPTCYGRVRVREEPLHDVTHLELSRLRDFADVPLTPTDVVMWRTVSRWRSTSRFDFHAIGGPTKPMFKSSQRTVFGGSIAKKSIALDGTITKSSSQAGFEGAGSAKIGAEVNFYLSLRRPSQEGLKNLFPRLIDYSVAPGSTSITLELLGDGSTVADSLSAGSEFPRQKVESLVGRLFRNSYLKELTQLQPIEGGRLFDTLYIGRTLDRLLSFGQIVEVLPVDSRLKEVMVTILSEGTLRVNGSQLSSPITLLRALSVKRAGSLFPKVVGPCGHGDLTILNLAWTAKQDLKLIDPRGVVGMWDPVYDLGKLAFSLSGFAECIKNQLPFSGDGDSFTIATDLQQSGFAQGRAWLSKWCAESSDLAGLRETEPHLAARIEFAEATHYLADVPYRLAQGMDSDRALSVLLLGCLRLSAVAGKLMKVEQN